MKLIIGTDEMLGPLSGPDSALFKRFSEHWTLIDRDQCRAASTDPYAANLVASFRNDIIEFAVKQLELEQPRDDYREFIELSLIYLGSTPSRGIHFQMPGAIHQARWMAKVLYVLKIWLFREQFELTRKEQNGICELAAFAVVVYLRAWMTALLAVEAPFNDFQLVQSLLTYPKPKISSVTSKKLSRHLWYLSEELVTLLLFDSWVTADTKKLMLTALQVPAPEHPSKRPRADSSVFLPQIGLEQFCTSNSKTIFRLLQLPTSFLLKDPLSWEDEEYQEALQFVKRLAVVNHRAEQGVALIQQFNKHLMKLMKGEQLQFLLQVVTDP